MITLGEKLIQDMREAQAHEVERLEARVQELEAERDRLLQAAAQAVYDELAEYGSSLAQRGYHAVKSVQRFGEADHG